MEIPDGVVDVHVHIQPWEQLRAGVRESLTGGRQDLEEIRRFIADPSALVARLDALGLARVGLVNYPAPGIMGFDGSTNDFVARYRDAAPERILAWGGLDPAGGDGDPGGAMERLLGELRLDGIKVHPPHQGIAPNAYLHGNRVLSVLYERCQEQGVPVMIHTGTSVFPGARSRLGDPMLCDDVAVDFPGLKIVLAHCGRPLWYEAAFFVARRHPNVFVDLSSIPPKRLPEVLPRLEVLGDKVLWGTDWPSPGVRDLRSNVEAFCALDAYSDDFKRRVLTRNPARLFPDR